MALSLRDLSALFASQPSRSKNAAFYSLFSTWNICSYRLFMPCVCCIVAVNWQVGWDTFLLLRHLPRWLLCVSLSFFVRCFRCSLVCLLLVAVVSPHRAARGSLAPDVHTNSPAAWLSAKCVEIAISKSGRCAHRSRLRAGCCLATSYLLLASYSYAWQKAKQGHA